MKPVENPRQDLANAIIAQAAEDYRAALERLEVDPKHEKSKWMLTDVERFFHSDYFRLMTRLDPDYILDRIRNEVKSRAF